MSEAVGVQPAAPAFTPKRAGAAVDWQSGVFTLKNFALESGEVLTKAELAYLHTGTLADHGSNAVLVTHGYTTGHHFVLPDSLAAEGSWSDLVGRGRAIDPERHFVVATNALGSCYGSSGPASVDPATGEIWGDAFPRVTMGDTVRLQRAFLESLGVTHLHAVAGPSMGGIQAFQWGVQFPDWVDKLVVAVSGIAPPARGAEDRDSFARDLKAHPAWNEGRPENGAMVPWLTERRLATLREYSMDSYLSDSGLEPDEVQAELSRLAHLWAVGFHPWSLVCLGQAMASFGVADLLHRIRAKVLLALCDNDKLFPARDGPRVMALLRDAHVEARYIEIASRYGHLASGIDGPLWARELREFLDD